MVIETRPSSMMCSTTSAPSAEREMLRRAGRVAHRVPDQLAEDQFAGVQLIDRRVGNLGD